MSFTVIRVSLLGGALLWIAGCGGSSGGGSGSGGSGGGGNPTTVTFSFAGAPPSAVATKIGTGSFAASSIASNTLTLSVPSGTTDFGVAYVCPPASVVVPLEITNQYVLESTISDGTQYSLGCPSSRSFPPLGTLSVSVDATAIADTSSLDFIAYNGQLSNTGAFSGATITNASLAAPVGSDQVDVLAYNSPNPNGLPFNETLLAARSFSGQAVPGSLNGGATLVLGAADQAIPQPITYSNVPSGFAAPSSNAIFNPSGAEFPIVLANEATSQYPSMPSGMVGNGGTYLIAASTIPTAGAAGLGPVYAFAVLTSGAPVSFNFPAPWKYAGPTPAALPSMTMYYTGFTGTTGVSQVAWINWGADIETQSQYQIMATANYQNGSTNLTFPDLSAASGFLAPPASGTTVEWVAAILESSSGDIPTLPASASGREVANAGTYTVP